MMIRPRGTNLVRLHITTTEEIDMRTIALAALLLGLSATSFAATLPELSYQQFEQQIKANVAPLAGKELAGMKVLYLSADVGPWLDTGISLKPGDKVTWEARCRSASPRCGSSPSACFKRSKA
jgi:hypothetical protein